MAGRSYSAYCLLSNMVRQDSVLMYGTACKIACPQGSISRQTFLMAQIK